MDTWVDTSYKTVIILSMAYTDKGRDAYKTRFRYGGKTITAACGTRDPKTANAVEEMILKLKRDRQHAILDALVNKRVKLARVYVMNEQGILSPDTIKAEIEKKPDPDLVPFIDDWLDGIRRMHNGALPGTYAKYEVQVRAMLGDCFSASKFTAAAILRYLRGLTVTGSTRNRYRTAFSRFADFLVDEEVVTETPIVRKKGRSKENDAREIWLDHHDDAKRLVMALPLPHRAAIALMLATGMEKQAVWRLRRRDIVFGARPTVRAHGGKKPWRHRVIPATDKWMWSVFEDYARNFLPDVVIFSNIRPDTTLDKLKKALKETKIDQLDHAPETMHDMRHCYAVFALRDGLPLHLVASQLGHHNTMLAQKVYARFVPNMEDYDLYLSRSALANPAPESTQSTA